MSTLNEDNQGLIYGIDDEPPVAETIALIPALSNDVWIHGGHPSSVGACLGNYRSLRFGCIDCHDVFISGLTTLLQVQWGNRLPIVQGGTFSLLAPTFAICGMAGLAEVGWEVRMQHVQGAIIAGAVVEIIVGASGLSGKCCAMLVRSPLHRPLP